MQFSSLSFRSSRDLTPLPFSTRALDAKPSRRAVACALPSCRKLIFPPPFLVLRYLSPSELTRVSLARYDGPRDAAVRRVPVCR